jgi:hypothetical protein
VSFGDGSLILGSDASEIPPHFRPLGDIRNVDFRVGRQYGWVDYFDASQEFALQVVTAMQGRVLPSGRSLVVEAWANGGSAKPEPEPQLSSETRADHGPSQPPEQAGDAPPGQVETTAQTDASDAPPGQVEATAETDASDAPPGQVETTAQTDASDAPPGQVEATAQTDASDAPPGQVEATAQTDASDAPPGQVEATAQTDASDAPPAQGQSLAACMGDDRGDLLCSVDQMTGVVAVDLWREAEPVPVAEPPTLVYESMPPVPQVEMGDGVSLSEHRGCGDDDGSRSTEAPPAPKVGSYVWVSPNGRPTQLPN